MGIVHSHLQKHHQQQIFPHHRRAIVITKHAQLRMVERGISDADLFDIVETGSTKFRD